ncbi:hypothetical protein [uncultured Nostoc sp.]|uniref:hypothetical protein n=1 Tax=uncultured Nostoc sp. TaxID=340711 RepID=UPI0035CCA0F5
MRIDWGGDDYAPFSDVYDGLRLRYFFHPQISYSAPNHQQPCPVSRQGRSSNSRMPSVIRWLVLTSNLCNANFKIIRFLRKARKLR